MTPEEQADALDRMLTHADPTTRLPALRATLEAARESKDPDVVGLVKRIGALLASIPTLNAMQHGETDDLRAAVAMAREIQRILSMKRRVSEQQRERRKGKPAHDPADTGRDARLRAHHERLIADGCASPTSDTAAEFNVSTRTVSRIVNGQ